MLQKFNPAVHQKVEQLSFHVCDEEDMMKICHGLKVETYHTFYYDRMGKTWVLFYEKLPEKHIDQAKIRLIRMFIAGFLAAN